MSQLPFEQLQLKRGVIQELTAQDHDSGLILHVRWKGGLSLQLSH